MQTPILLLITKVGCLLCVFCFVSLRSPKPEGPNCVLGSTGLCKAFNAHEYVQVCLECLDQCWSFLGFQLGWSLDLGLRIGDWDLK